MRRLKQKNAASKGGEAHSCSLDPSAISASVKDVLHLRIDMLNAVLLQRDEMLKLCIEITMKWKDKCEYWKARAENGNHQTILLCKTFGLGYATLKNGYSVAVRKNAEYPGERTPVILNAGECFVYISTSDVMFEGAPITFYELPDGCGFVHDFCPDTPQTRQSKSFYLPRPQPLQSKTFHSTPT